MSTSTPDFAAIQAAARQLEQGKLVAFPTETVYGLGADAENPVAVAGIYKAKGRPSDHPVIVHIAPEANICYWAEGIVPQVHQLIAAFWPGPLTLILQRAAHIPAQVSGGQSSIGLRCPSHPVAQALLREFKNGQGGVAAPSANKFGYVSPTTAQHVRAGFADESLITSILDGGQSTVGIESTILDLSRMATHGPVLLRPGHIHVAEIAAVLGLPVGQADAAAPRVSGNLISHYAPRTSVVLIPSVDLREYILALQQAGKTCALMHYSPIDVTVFARFSMLATPEAYAYDLYVALRSMDAVAADVIVIEMPPSGAVWEGIHDRLQRAAH